MAGGSNSRCFQWSLPTIVLPRILDLNMQDTSLLDAQFWFIIVYRP